MRTLSIPRPIHTVIIREASYENVDYGARLTIKVEFVGLGKTETFHVSQRRIRSFVRDLKIYAAELYNCRPSDVEVVW